MEDTTNKQNPENQNRQTIEILLEEWKKNVDLYIDQDKRAFSRIGVFVLIHAGLLIFYEKMFVQNSLIPCLVAIIGLYATRITQKMSFRAHAFILLRKLQGMLIENKLKESLEKNNEDWKTESGIITTFTREHVVFREELPEEEKKWEPLKTEVEKLGSFAAKCLSANWNPSIAPLEWLQSKRFYKWLIERYKRAYCWVFKNGREPEQELLPSMKHLKWLIRIYMILYVLWIALLTVALWELVF